MGLWLAPWIGAISYPFFIFLFPIAMAGYRETGNPLLAGGAGILMSIAGSVPVLAGWALKRSGDRQEARLVRIILCLIFAVPPLYVLSVLLAWATGIGPYHRGLWVAGWAVIGTALYFRGQAASTSSGPRSTWMRALHGAVAACLLLGFLFAHLFNHALALWSVPLHTMAMKYLRNWYRAPWIEDVLLGLLLAMAATGLPMVRRFAGRKLDAFGAMQIGTGVYLGVFLCSHLLAVLGARRAGTETDWIFAAGRAGLLHGDGMLIPYYILAVFFLVLHCACGLRIVLLKHGTAQVRADRVFYGTAALGLLATAPIATALLGFHVYR